MAVLMALHQPISFVSVCSQSLILRLQPNFFTLVLDPNVKDLYFQSQWRSEQYAAGMKQLEEVVSHSISISQHTKTRIPLAGTPRTHIPSAGTRCAVAPSVNARGRRSYRSARNAHVLHAQGRIGRHAMRSCSISQHARAQVLSVAM
jgi:hypothetical protein